MVNPHRIFTPHKRRLLRRRFTLAETLFGAGFLLAVAGATAWIAAQADHFDPADRDISFEVLKEQSVDQELFTPPLRRWVEPGSAASASGLPELGSFPTALLDDGWQLDGRVESYDASNLYEKIDGAADQFLGFGFRRLDYVTVSRGSDFLNAEIYDQGEFQNALGLFSAQRPAGREVKSAGELYYYATPVGIIGGYRNLYFKIAGSSGAPSVLGKAEAILALIPRLPSSVASPPRPFLILTGDLGIPFNALQYQKSDVFAYDFLSDVWFGTVAADARFFIHEARNAASAAELYEKLGDEQKNEYALIQEGEDTLLLEHRFLKTFFAMRRSGPFLLGIEGAPTRESARDALGRLGKAVSLEGRRETDPEA